MGARVGEQVGENLVQPSLIAGHLNRFVGEGEFPLVRGRSGAGVADRIDGKQGQIHRAPLEGSPRIKAGEQQQILDEPLHAQSLRLHPRMLASGVRNSCEASATN